MRRRSPRPPSGLPRYATGLLAVAVLGSVLLTGGSRYRARLHISMLDELPFVLGRLLAGGGIVAAGFALLHQSREVAAFLAVGLAGMGLVVGRTITNQIVLLGRHRRVWSIAP